MFISIPKEIFNFNLSTLHFIFKYYCESGEVSHSVWTVDILFRDVVYDFGLDQKASFFAFLWNPQSWICCWSPPSSWHNTPVVTFLLSLSRHYSTLTTKKWPLATFIYTRLLTIVKLKLSDSPCKIQSLLPSHNHSMLTFHEHKRATHRKGKQQNPIVKL